MSLTRILLLLALVYLPLSSNPLLASYSFLILYFIVSRYEQLNAFAIFAFCFSFQWLQASIKIFHADINGVRLLDEVNNIELMYHFFQPEHSVNLPITIFYSLTGLFFLAFGAYTVLRKSTINLSIELNLTRLSDISLKSVLQIYVVTSLFIFPLLQSIAWSVPGLTQPIYAILFLRSGILFFVLSKLLNEKNYTVLMLIVLLELAIGFTSFFSDFKTVFFVLALVFLTSGYKLGFRQFFLLVPVATLVFYLGVTWTAVKGDYREFLTGGERNQYVVVDSDIDKLGYFFNLVTETSQEKLKSSLDNFLLRISYVDFFAATVTEVPKNIDHKEGQVWQAAFANLVPRVLFPDKPKLPSDSEHTMEHTGLYLATGNQASFSIGYMGDSYIDFGPVLMFVPIFLLGLLYAKIYQWLMRLSHNTIFGYIFVVSVLFHTYQLEMASVKLLGRILMGTIVYSLILYAFRNKLKEWAEKHSTHSS